MLIEDQVEEDFSTMLSNKISLKIGTAIDNLRSKINNTKEFLSATSQKQASITLKTQQAADKSLKIGLAQPLEKCNHKEHFLSINLPITHKDSATSPP